MHMKYMIYAYFQGLKLKFWRSSNLP